MVIIPTIDVEGTHGPSPWKQLAQGDVGEREDWGALRIARILREYGITGTFFVDVYESSLWGTEPVRRICEELMELDQDVQLHTHPSWRDDPRDSLELRTLKKEKSYFPQELDMMARLSRQQQVEVLAHGCELLKCWTGKYPTVHRSGGYSINADTVDAMREVGILVDSSMKYSHKHSQLAWSVNQVVECKGILEIPCTQLKYQFGIGKSGQGLLLYSKLIPTDLNDSNLNELKYFVNEGKRIGVQMMNLFMHSYSLLHLDYYFKRIKPDPNDEKKLRRFLEFALNRQGVQVCSCAEFHEAWRAGKVPNIDTDPVPSITTNIRIATMALKKITHQVRYILASKQI